MKEFLKIIPYMFKSHRRRVEATIVPQHSLFVLKQGEQERRLYVGEKTALDPGSYGAENEQITSFVVSPEPTYLSLATHAPNNPISFQRAQWGYAFKYYGTHKQEWTISYTEHAYAQRDGNKYINGSSMYFNDEKTQLHGPGWILEYRPLESNS